MTDDFVTKITHKFNCIYCDYKCSRPSEWSRHIATQKHIKLTLCDKNHVCSCGKFYKHRQSLFNHKKVCQEIKNEIIVVKEEPKDYMIEFIKQSQDLQKQNQDFQKELFTQIVEFMKLNPTTNNIVNGNINNNTQFNLQLFLNETCKNAMTIDEFLDYLQPTIEELEDTARLGYVEGITRIIMRGLKDLEAELRPFHCTDLKRETMFIKNTEGEWEKEIDEKPILLKFVKAVSRKNFNNLNAWKKQNPTYNCYDSKKNDLLNQILINSTSGRTEKEQLTNYEKVIKNIAKETVIDKSKKNKTK